MGIEDDSKWGSDGLDDSWGPPIPPPPAEMPPPPPPVGDSNLSRSKGGAPLHQCHHLLLRHNQ